MRLIACHDGKLHALDSSVPAIGPAAARSTFSSGIPQLDAVAPGGGFARGAIHELLTHPADGKAMFFAMLLAAASANSLQTSNLKSQLSNPPLPTGSIIWCDLTHELYPPGLAAHGFPLDRAFLLHPQMPDPQDKNLIWAANESLRCKGVSAVVAPISRLSRIQARRLQLSAERGGGVGLLLRPAGPRQPAPCRRLTLACSAVARITNHPALDPSTSSRPRRAHRTNPLPGALP